MPENGMVAHCVRIPPNLFKLQIVPMEQAIATAVSVFPHSFGKAFEKEFDMSSISGVSRSSTSWLQMLQAQANGSTSSTSSTSSTTSADSTSATSSTDATTSTKTRGHHGKHGGGFTKALEDQGITGTKLSDLRTKIDTAMKSAKEEGTDPKDAINGVLQDAGVDLDAFQQDMKSQGRPGGPNGAGGPRPGGPPPDGTAPTDLTDSADSTSTSSASALNSLLSGTGIDATTFQSSLMSMLNSGSTDTSSLFSGASVGSSLDIAA